MEISNSQPRKIAYIITLPDLGGAQSHLYEVMINIKDYGYAPILITGRQGWLTEKLQEKDIPCHIVPNLVREISPIHDFKAVKDIKRIIRCERPVLVHCHSSKAGIVGRIAARWCQIPAVFTAHGWAFTDGIDPLKRRIYAWIEKMAGYWTDKIICVSDYDRNLGMKQLLVHKDKMVTIHNGVPDRLDLVREFKKNPVGDVIRIIVVARFSPQKKNIQILRVLREILNQGMKITITFVGDGPQLEMAKVEAARLNLDEEVVFLGARTDVIELLPKYDLFLLLSNWEGFPISILEAMRAGLPIVASDVGGVSEALKNNENGFLISRDDGNVLEVLKTFYINKELFGEMGGNSRRILQKYFLSNNMISSLNRVYNQVLG